MNLCLNCMFGPKLALTHQHDWWPDLSVSCPRRSSLWNETLEVSVLDSCLDQAQLSLCQPEAPRLCSHGRLMPAFRNMETVIKVSQGVFKTSRLIAYKTSSQIPTSICDIQLTFPLQFSRGYLWMTFLPSRIHLKSRRRSDRQNSSSRQLWIQFSLYQRDRLC